MAHGFSSRRLAVLSTLLVALVGGSPASAQDVLALEQEFGLQGDGGEASVAITFEGVVHDPSGAPAEGAVVVSSAGGQAVTDPSGSFQLETRVPVEAESVQITAVGRAGRNLMASASVALPAANGTVHVDELALAQGGACQPSWLPTFGGQPGVSYQLHSLAVFDDGGGPSLYAGGYFTTAGGIVANGIAMWDGSDWAPLGSGMYLPGSIARVLALTVFDDGGGPALYAGGTFTTAGGVAANYIAKWDGSSWAPLGSGMNAAISALAVFDDGGGSSLYAGGYFTTAGGGAANFIAKWDGATWAALGSGVNSYVKALAVFDEGGGPSLYAGGNFTTAGGGAANFIAKWGGATWAALGSGVSGGGPLYVDALTVFDDGGGPMLCAGGYFTTAGGVTANSIAKWDGTIWTPYGNGMSGGVFALTLFDDGGGPALLAGGYFTTAGSVAADNIAEWDGATWAALGSGLNQEVSAMTVFDDGGGQALYAGGGFTTTGGVVAINIAKWDGSSWAALGSGMSAPANVYPTVRALTTFDGGGEPALYAGGTFITAGGVTANRVAKWDGSSWQPLGNGMDSTVLALTAFDDGGGPALYAGGTFTTAGSGPANYIAKWDGAAWTALGSGMNGGVYALALFDDGGGPALYAGGTFKTAGGVAVNYIAKWDGSSWTALGSGMSFWVSALAVFDDGGGPALYAGGQFTAAGGVAASRVAKWNGSNWTPLGSGTNDAVEALAVFDEGGGPALYVGGWFGTAGGVAASGIAKWNGSSWAALGSGMSGVVEALTVFDDGTGPSLYAGGSILAIDSGDAGLAKWGCAPPAPATYCTAGTSASGCQALLSASGSPSATAVSGFTLQAGTVEGQKDGLFFFGTNGQQANSWGNGTSYQCVVPPVVRAGTLSGTGTIGACDGAFAQDLNALWCPSCPKPAKNPGPGATVQAQLWYRDPASTSNQTTSLSDAIEFVVGL